MISANAFSELLGGRVKDGPKLQEITSILLRI